MNTNKERFLGLIRELLTAGGALAFGAFDGAASVVGLIVAVASVLWAWKHHEGAQVIATSFRKVLSLVPGVLLALGVVDPDTAGMIAAFIAPLFAIVWSFLDKGGSVPNSSGRLGAWLMAALALLSCGVLPSCGGNVTLTPDQIKAISRTVEVFVIPQK